MASPAEIRAQRVGELVAQAARHLAEGNTAAALQCVHRALALRPGDAHCMRLVGEIYRRMGKEVLAQRAFAAAAAQDRQFAAAGQQAATPAPAPPAIAPAVVPEPTTPAPRRDPYAHLKGGPRPVAPEPQPVSAPEPQAEAPAARAGGDSQATDPVPAAANQPQAPPPGPEPAPTQAAPSPEHHALPPFTQILGPIPGALTDGPQVLNLQKLLNLEGLEVAESGRYDGPTLVAVRALQRKYGIARPDGMVGGDTRRLLNRLTGHDAPLAALKDRQPYPDLRLGDNALQALDRLQESKQ